MEKLYSGEYYLIDSEGDYFVDPTGDELVIQPISTDGSEIIEGELCVYTDGHYDFTYTENGREITVSSEYICIAEEEYDVAICDNEMEWHDFYRKDFRIYDGSDKMCRQTVFKSGKTFTYAIETGDTDIDRLMNEVEEQEGDDIDLTDYGEHFICNHVVKVYENASKMIGIVFLDTFMLEEIGFFTEGFLAAMDSVSGDYLKMAGILYDNGYDYDEDFLSQPNLIYIRDFKLAAGNTAEENNAVIECVRIFGQYFFNMDILAVYFLNLPDKHSNSDSGSEQYIPTLEEKFGLYIAQKKMEHLFSNNDKNSSDDSEIGIVLSDRQKNYIARKAAEKLDLFYDNNLSEDEFDKNELSLMYNNGYKRFGSTQLMFYRYGTD